MQPEDIRLMIDGLPVVDTQYERDKNTLQMADYELNNESGISLAEMKKSIRVIYWKIDDNQHQDTIAGVAWPQKDKAIFFSGKVLAP